MQGKLWSSRPAIWATLQEPLTAPLYEAAFDAIQLDAGVSLLDAGCGSGYALMLAARRGAAVTGIDAAEGLVEIARERVPGARIQLGELEELPFEDGEFDAVTAFNSVQYSADPVQALRELRRVAGPGTPVVVATWGDPQRCEFREVLAAVGSLLPPPPPGAGGPFALSVPGALETLVDTAGLTPVDGEEVSTPFRFADITQAWEATAASGPAARAIAEAGEDALRAAVVPVLERFATPEGEVHFANTFRYVIAKA
jgi:SAM-dependent methyltransferase